MIFSVLKFVNLTQMYISCEKSGGLYLVELGLTVVGRQASRQMVALFYTIVGVLILCGKSALGL